MSVSPPSHDWVIMGPLCCLCLSPARLLSTAYLSVHRLHLLVERSDLGGEQGCLSLTSEALSAQLRLQVSDRPTAKVRLIKKPATCSSWKRSRQEEESSLVVEPWGQMPARTRCRLDDSRSGGPGPVCCSWVSQRCCTG